MPQPAAAPARVTSRASNAGCLEWLLRDLQALAEGPSEQHAPPTQPGALRAAAVMRLPASMDSASVVGFLKSCGVRMPPATGWYRRWWWVASRAAVCRSGISPVKDVSRRVRIVQPRAQASQKLVQPPPPPSPPSHTHSPHYLHVCVSPRPTHAAAAVQLTLAAVSTAGGCPRSSHSCKCCVRLHHPDTAGCRLHSRF